MSDQDTIRAALGEMGGHSHWREGGAGGVCSSCERNAELRAAALAALDSLVARLAEAEEALRELIAAQDAVDAVEFTVEDDNASMAERLRGPVGRRTEAWRQVRALALSPGRVDG